MNEQQQIKRVKNIAAVLYMLAMIFLVGGSYWHQQQKEIVTETQQSSP
jgi:surface polysaccharide O-acyltransferase-like enzyme